MTVLHPTEVFLVIVIFKLLDQLKLIYLTDAGQWCLTHHIMEKSFLQHAGYKELKDKYPCFIEQVELAERKIQRNLEEIEPWRGPTKPVSVKSHNKRSESKDSGIQSLASSAGSEGCYRTWDRVKDDAGERQNRTALNDDDDDDDNDDDDDDGTVPKERHDIQALNGRRDDDDDDETVPKERHDIQTLGGRRDMSSPGEDHDRPENVTTIKKNVNSCLKLTLKLGKHFNIHLYSKWTYLNIPWSMRM